MKSLPIIISFLPLIAFSLLARLLPSGDIGIAGIAAAGCALVALLALRPLWPPKILGAASFVVFLIIGILGFTLAKPDDSWLATWAGTGVALVLGAIILLLIPVKPVTEQFAPRSAARNGASPAVKQLHRTLSAAWGAAIMLIGAARVLAEVIEKHTSSHHLAEILLGTLVPLGILYYMLKFSKSYPQKYLHRAQAGSPVAQGQAGPVVPGEGRAAQHGSAGNQPGRVVPGQGAPDHDDSASQRPGSDGRTMGGTGL